METINEALNELNKGSIKKLNENLTFAIKDKKGNQIIVNDDYIDYCINGYSFVRDILNGKVSDSECQNYYFVDYNFDEVPPADNIEKLICKALKTRIDRLDESVSTKDDIDAAKDKNLEESNGIEKLKKLIKK